MFKRIRGLKAVRRQEMGVRLPPPQPRLRTQLNLHHQPLQLYPQSGLYYLQPQPQPHPQLDPQSGQKRELELEHEEWERSLHHRDPW